VDLLWTDIETSGLDERGGLLLELGLIVTGPGPRFEERAAWSAVVGYPDIRSRIRSAFVRQMHEANGLLVEVERSRRARGPRLRMGPRSPGDRPPHGWELPAF